jgi:ABC-type multidrug transport system ATPase subunit
MARALLRRSFLAMMDEATSSVDFATDAKIQKAIREEFTDSLPVSIPFYAVAELHLPLLDHSRSSPEHHHRFVVLDHGRVVEFDTPYTLIRKENGVLRSMCLKSGSFGELEAAARARRRSPPTCLVVWLIVCLCWTKLLEFNLLKSGSLARRGTAAGHVC